jgi:hypothetical protein
MKTLIFRQLSVVFAVIILMSCNKEQLLPQKNSEAKETIQQLNKTAAVVYANLSCDLPNGETGCECTITSSDDDCELQTSCTAQSSLVHYDAVLQEMFTPEEILFRARTKVRITETKLKDALRLDRFPLKK